MLPDEKNEFLKNLEAEARATTGAAILYLDDEPDLLDAVGEVFRSLGFEFFGTVDPEEALRWAASRRTELALVISDLRMPEMGGFEFREKMQALAHDVPFAILSAFVDKDIAIKGVELKICGFLSKPLKVEHLADLTVRDVIPRLKNIREERELRAGFVADAEELVSQAEGLLMALEQDPRDEGSLNRLFGIVHTLKGASSFFEPKTLHHFVHRYEDLLKGLQRREFALSEEVCGVLFRGFDVIKELFAEFKELNFAPRDLPTLLKVLDISKSASEEKPGQPEARPEAADVKADAPKGNAMSKPDDVRVSVGLLDEFMQLSGEVTVIRNMLNKCVRSIERQYAGDRDIAMLGELLEELHKINGGVQGKISDIRKVPVKNVLKPIPRAVRDVSKELGKKIELTVEGDDLRVDTAIAEILNNCMLHLVKNSMDHGLEGPAERVKAGKPEKGRVTIRFFEREKDAVIEIEDDGRGINVEAIKSKLVKNGTHTPQQANALSNEELYDMIFAPGFSTAAKVTDISGRGVGMSMVKDSVDAAGGEIKIESNPGKGAKFRISLPIPKSVLIASCLSVRAGDSQLGLIQDDVMRVLQFAEKDRTRFVREAEGASMLLLEWELIPMANLSDLLRLPKRAQGNDPERIISVVVLQSGQDSRRMAVVVDEILDTEDTVIKSVHPSLNPHQMFRGATFLDNGTIGLILNTTGLMDRIGLVSEPKAARSEKKAEQAEKRGAEELAILVDLCLPGTYAVRQSDVIRIEEVNRQNLRHSGRRLVIPYRGGVLPIIDLAGLLGGSGSPEVPEVFPVIVIQRENRKYGIRVDKVIDLVPIEGFSDELRQTDASIAGHFVHQEKTISLLAMEEAVDSLGDEAENTQAS